MTSIIEDLKALVYKLTQVVNAPGLSPEQRKKGMREATKAIYLKYCILKSDFTAGAISHEDFKRVVGILIRLVNLEYLSLVPAIEILLAEGWEKVRV